MSESFKPTFESLKGNRQELLGMVLKEAPKLSAEEKLKVAMEVVQHSIEDGLTLAESLDLSKEEKYYCLTTDRFTEFHEVFEQELAGVTMEEIKAKRLDPKYRHIIGQLNMPEKPTKFPAELEAKSETAQTLLGFINGYYSQYLGYRFSQTPEKRSKGAEKTLNLEGGKENWAPVVERAETFLQQNQIMLEPHYLTGEIIKSLQKVSPRFESMTRTELKEALTTLPGTKPDQKEALDFLFHSSLVSEEQMDIIESAMAIPAGDRVRARYRPLDMVYKLKAETLKEELLKDVADSIGIRDSDAEVYEVLDEGEKGTYNVRYKQPVEGQETSSNEKIVSLGQFSKREHQLPFDLKQNFIAQNFIGVDNGLPVVVYKTEEKNTVAIEKGDQKTARVTLGDDEYMTLLALKDKNGPRLYTADGHHAVIKRDVNDPRSQPEVFPGLQHRPVKVGDNVMYVQMEFDPQKKKIKYPGGEREASVSSVIANGEEVWVSDELIYSIVNVGGKPAYIIGRDADRADFNKDDTPVRVLFDGKEYGPYLQAGLRIYPDGESIAFRTFKTDADYNKRESAMVITDRGVVQYKGEVEDVVCSAGSVYAVEFIRYSGEKLTEMFLTKDGVSIDGPHEIMFTSFKNLRDVDGNFMYIDAKGKNEKMMQNDSPITETISDASMVDYYKFDDDWYVQTSKRLEEGKSENRLCRIENKKLIPVNDEAPFDAYIHVVQQDGYLVLSGIQDGVYVTYTRDLNPQRRIQERGNIPKLTAEEQRKLDLLRLVANPDPEKISEYFDMKGFDPNKLSIKEKLKNFLMRSPAVARGIHKATAAHPEEFIEGVSATGDRSDRAYVQSVVERIFPEIGKAKSKENQASFWSSITGFFKGGPSAAEYLSRNEHSSMLGADPRQRTGERVLKLREEVNEVISGGVFIGFNAESNRWDSVPFPVSPELRDPVREQTFETPIPKKYSGGPIVLHKLLGAEIIPDRIKGITKNGGEIKLQGEANALGEYMVTLPPGEKIVSIVYSQRRQELPVIPEDISNEDYDKFRAGFVKEFGETTVAEITTLSPEDRSFVDSLVGMSPREKFMAIEQYVRDIGYYDFDNGKVNKQKEGLNPSQQIAFMETRMRELKAKKPKLAAELSGKRYAGVCSDFAVLNTALLRRAGFVSGVIEGLRPSGVTVTADQAHGISAVVWPKGMNEYQVIGSDGTPGGVTAQEKKELKSIQQPSLAEKLEEAKNKIKEYTESLPEKFREVEELLKNASPEDIKALGNGRLESLLNLVLTYQVKNSHVEAVEAVLNAARYGGFDVTQLEKGNLDGELEFRRFLEGEIARVKANPSSEVTPAGEKLMKTMMGFIEAYKKDKSADKAGEAFDDLERIIDLSSSKLDPIEKRAAVAVITYLKARRMTKSK